MSIYFIQIGVDGPVKIGRTINPSSRLHELQTSNHETLSLIRLVEGGRREEFWFHREFQHLHIRSEWFKFHQDMLTSLPDEVIKKGNLGLSGRPGKPLLNKLELSDNTQKQRRLRERRNAQGLRQLTIWVPECRITDFIEIAKLACDNPDIVLRNKED